MREGPNKATLKQWDQILLSVLEQHGNRKLRGLHKELPLGGEVSNRDNDGESSFFQLKIERLMGQALQARSNFCVGLSINRSLQKADRELVRTAGLEPAREVTPEGF